MSYPNVPLSDGGNLADWQRRVAGAINWLLNRFQYFDASVSGMPDAGQVLLDTQFPIPYVISSTDCIIRSYDAATDDAEIDFWLAGVLIARATILAGETEGAFGFINSRIEPNTQFQITAPDPQDATLSGLTLILALKEA